ADAWRSYAGPNLGYIWEKYEQYEQDPKSVEPEYRELFKQYGPPPAEEAADHIRYEAGTTAREVPPSPKAAEGEAAIRRAIAAGKLVWQIRAYGHLDADLDPLRLEPRADTGLFEPESYGLTRGDLAAMPAASVWEEAPPDVRNGAEAIARLKEAYTQCIAYEFAQVHDREERNWLVRRAEIEGCPPKLEADERRSLLGRLIQVEEFERFLHRTFAGQKRFSIEGLDMLVPMLDDIVRRAAEAGTGHVIMGMAHRGRLNVLAHVLGKPYGAIFSEFHHSPNKDLVPSEGSMGINVGWTGDVKYHLGRRYELQGSESGKVRITLADNPSHLEFVNPLVEGFARAAQETRAKAGYPERDGARAVPVLIHGDAAFAGEGIVAETLNLGSLRGYSSGGTIHIIANNGVGFTTDTKDARSTRYASDLAKGYEIPILHVNADNPEACMAAVRMALDYRSRFQKDFLIDLVGYRRFGHNEMDDPDATQPLMYLKVKEHPTAAALYGEALIRQGFTDRKTVERVRDESRGKLQQAYETVKQHETVDPAQANAGQAGAEGVNGGIRTAVPLERLKRLTSEMLDWPEGFTAYPKLKRILERRTEAWKEGGAADWALAETMAFATMLEDGVPIRLSGQDAERGTFAHRHLILHDPQSGATDCPLHRITRARASFAVYNSPLSEAGVLGFDYGYSVLAPEALVIWEAQYGDFANAAQVIFDQFIAAGRAKWSQRSGLVILLPHGYEGQGPEHSSARLERFLQLAADDNWAVANLTRSSQYFHLLRRQAATANTNAVKPLVLMAPKSLIRHPRVASPALEFTDGAFRPVWEQPGTGEDAANVRRLIVCSGKIAIDLEDALAHGEANEALHIVRVERLYPFPEQELSDIAARYPKLEELVWVQEEPRNMGAWFYAEPYVRALAPEGAAVRYIGRPERSSPASGYQHVHGYEQHFIVREALKPAQTENRM
ncbi:2-oxoglutarate dehydrogenase, partial [Paenibacillus darwinianus]